MLTNIVPWRNFQKFCAASKAIATITCNSGLSASALGVEVRKEVMKFSSGRMGVSAISLVMITSYVPGGKVGVSLVVGGFSLSQRARDL